MADKYESNITGKNSLIVTIPSGPAAGAYEIFAPKVDADGRIYLATITVAGRRDPVQLKISAAENPGIVAKIAAIDAEMNRQIAAESAANAAEERLAEQMRDAGFEAAGNGERLINRVEPVDGNNF